jgi:ferrous iron transport protein B
MTNNKSITIAFAGNPNCGKTTLFNNLTGTHQRVGNWPGVTVDRVEGAYRDGDGVIDIVDLPGVYTMGTVPGSDGGSLDETVARDFILSGKIDVLINVVNAANLERNLYLTAQLIEMRVPMLVVLNMMDVAHGAGLRIDPSALAEKLGVPVVAMSAVKNNGNKKLVEVVRAAARKAKAPATKLDYPTELQALINDVAQELAPARSDRDVDPRWLAVRLIEGDVLACSLIADALCEGFSERAKIVEADCGEDIDILIADGRFTFAHGAAQASLSRAFEAKRSTSDAIDQLVLNRFAGPVIFLGLIYLMFMFTINLGGAFIDFFDQAAGALFVDTTRYLTSSLGLPQMITVLAADGLGGGIQIVATFIPIIGFLYLFLSFLEDSGYMARAAFLMDQLMRKVGLPGKAFVPLIVGFGCNVPAIMASRTLEHENDRILTTMMSPFMSCGARLTIYALFTAAFFPTNGPNIVFALYLIGIVAALATGFLLKKTMLKGETTEFIMELPPYRMPRLKNLLLHSWIKLKGFIFGAGQMIVMVVVILSFLNSVGTDGSFGNEDSKKSVLSEIGRTITPVFAPIGLERDNWPAAVGLFTGIFAKEAVVGTLNSLYSAEAGISPAADNENGLNLLGKFKDALLTIPENFAGLTDLVADPLGIAVTKSQGNLEEDAVVQEVSTSTFGAMTKFFDGRIGAFAYLLFILLYFPCVAALGAVVNESGGKWAAFAGLWSTGLAYFVSVTFYQTATFMRHPLSSSLWIGGLIVLMAAFIVFMRRQGERDVPSGRAYGAAE